MSKALEIFVSSLSVVILVTTVCAIAILFAGCGSLQSSAVVPLPTPSPSLRYPTA